MKTLHVDNKPPSMVDDYQDFNTKNILFGRFDKLPNRYIGLITVSVIKAYTIENNVNGNRIDDNDWTKFFDELYYKYPDYTYEQLCELLKSTMKTKNNNDNAYPTFEYVVAAAMFAYKSQNAELITRLHNTFGRPLKLDCKNAWLDNWSLNGPGNALNFIFWKDYDSEDRISYSEYFHDADLIKELECYSETEKSHSKFIKREYYMTNHINWITNYKEWKNIKSIGYERKTIESLNNDKKTIEERFFIISFENDIKIFADAVRKHWGIENNLHAPLDIVFKEDDNTTLEKNGARNLSVLKRIALNIIKLVQCFYNISLKLIRYKISMNTEEELEKIFKTINTTQIKSMLENQT